MIKDSVLEAIKAIDLQDVIGRYVQLKRRGANMVACCPIHDEKTPSFYVSPSKQIFKCYGCGVGGDSISFIIKKENVDFPEAVKILCERFDIPIEVDERVEQSHLAIKRRQIIMKWACEYFESNFKGSVAHEYALNRGISDEISHLFAVGYTGQGLRGLMSHLTDKGVSIVEMEELSLVKARSYDFFRNRIVFPVRDHLGYVVAFSARALVDGQAPKYINSSDTPLYSKSKNLFALDIARANIGKMGCAIVVEGAPDAISMHQHGYGNTVGTLGTSLTKEHAAILKKYTQNVVLMYDGDNAGLKAIFRAALILFEEGLFIKVCRLPEGDDPDTFVRKHSRDYVSEYISKESRDFIEFRLSLLGEAVGDKVVLMHELKAMIVKFPDIDARQVMLHEYGKKIGLNYAAPAKKVVKKTSNDVDAHLARVCLMYGYEPVSRFFESQQALEMVSDGEMLSLLIAIRDNKVGSMHQLRACAPVELISLAEKCLDFHSDLQEDIDIEMALIRFDIYGLDVLERRIKTGDALYGNPAAMLRNIKREKAVLAKELADLENGLSKMAIA
jgi:DNA primase